MTKPKIEEYCRQLFGLEAHTPVPMAFADFEAIGLG